MGKYLGPRNKKARRIGMDLGLKTNPKLLERRLNTPPGQHGRRGRHKLSDYGLQLQEKQKVKWLYNVRERQLKRYYQRATKNPQATGAVFLQLLERRLDNVLYRLGFTPTRASARQLISHGHVQVDGQKVDIPSYLVKPQQTISLSSTALNIPYIKDLFTNKSFTPPAWLARKAAVGKVLRLPERQDIKEDIYERLIIEFYSR